MKIINIILSIVFLLLSCMPCVDMEVIGNMHSSHEITSNTDKHSHDISDACSPFCVCSCCGSQVFVNYTHYNFSSFKKIIDTKVPEYKSALTCNYYGSIWQPPQINS